MKYHKYYKSTINTSSTYKATPTPTPALVYIYIYIYRRLTRRSTSSSWRKSRGRRTASRGGGPACACNSNHSLTRAQDQACSIPVSFPLGSPRFVFWICQICVKIKHAIVSVCRRSFCFYVLLGSSVVATAGALRLASGALRRWVGGGRHGRA